MTTIKPHISARVGRSKCTGRQIAFSVFAFAFLAGLAVVTLLPFVWMLSTSLKLDTEVFTVPIQWLPNQPRWNNYQRIFERMPNFFRYYGNSLKLAVSVTALQILTSSMAAFSFAKLDYPFRKTLLMAYLATMMVPYNAIMVPQFMLINDLGLYDTHLAIICLQAFTPFGVFLMYQFFRSIPNSLMEAASIEGAGFFRIYSRIILPLSLPACSTLGIMTFISSLNDFMAPFMYISSDELKTITLALRSIASQNTVTGDYPLQMACTVMMLFPILVVFIIGQKQIINGLALGGGGAIKG